MIFSITANHPSQVLTKTAALFSRFGVVIEQWHMSHQPSTQAMSQHIKAPCEWDTARRIEKQLMRMVDILDVECQVTTSLSDNQANERVGQGHRA